VAKYTLQRSASGKYLIQARITEGRQTLAIEALSEVERSQVRSGVAQLAANMRAIRRARANPGRGAG
jgi:hypothetical protein